ncbi:Putative AC transposase [Linum grandiflorum]
MEPVSTNQAHVDDDVLNAAPPVPPPVGGAVNNENQPQDAVVVLPLGATRKLTSDVWPHFTRLFVNEVLKAKCNYCKKVLAGRSTNGTSHLRTHRDFCVQKQIHDGTQKILGPNYKAKGKTELSANQFSSDVSRKELCIMILMHEYPLSMVDHLYFKRFCCTLQPLFKVPTRNTVKKDILNLYETQRANMQRRIDQNKGRIAITTDMWTATNQKRGYMAVTGHYVDDSGKLRGHLLRFLYLPAPHTSERLAAKLSQCLLDWNIDTKLSTITLDNCTTNDAMINLVRESLLPSNLIHDGALLHMRCSAHILNLIVRDGLEVVKDGIEKIRESVVFWTCTPRRVEYFHDNAKQCKLSVSNKLVLDCPTRWNSTYEMLRVAIPYKVVFERLKKREAQYNSLPNDNHWIFAAAVCEKLEVFASMTEIFSGLHYPTANQFFIKVCELRLHMLSWLDDPNHIISRMAGKMWLKFSKYWNDIHLLLAVAVVLDPRYKLHIVEYFAAKFGSTNTDLAAERVKSVLVDLFREYQSKDPNPADYDIGDSSVDASDLDFDLYVSQRKKSRTTVITTELDHYLAEDVVPRSKKLPSFDILNWWNLYGAKYPTLHRIAKDILAVPITSVASESAFSSGGRLLDPHRSRLQPSTVEAMMCCRSWIQDEVRGGGGVTEREMQQMEGIFSALVMEDSSMEEITDGDGSISNVNGDDDDSTVVRNQKD